MHARPSEPLLPPLDAYTQLLNYSGCGNTVNANPPAVTRLILDSLRQWVTEYHVDGFRFDLATALCRDARGHLLPAPPLIRAIAKDPVLSQVKLIAEPWDIGADAEVGRIASHAMRPLSHAIASKPTACSSCPVIHPSHPTPCPS